MSEFKYPVHVCVFGGADWEGIPNGGYTHKRFAAPGELADWASDTGFFDPYADELQEVGVHEKCEDAFWDHGAEQACPPCRVLLDMDAELWLEESDCEARVFHSDEAWAKFQDEELEGDGEPTPPAGWQAVPYQACGCEDYPCCVHADSVYYVP